MQDTKGEKSMDAGIATTLAVAAIFLGAISTVNLYEDNQRLQVQVQSLQAELRGLRDGVNMSRDN